MYQASYDQTSHPETYSQLVGNVCFLSQIYLLCSQQKSKVTSSSSPTKLYYMSCLILLSEPKCCQFNILVLTSLFPQQNTFKHKTEVTSRKKKSSQLRSLVTQLITSTDTLYLSLTPGNLLKFNQTRSSCPSHLPPRRARTNNSISQSSKLIFVNFSETL